MMRSAFFDSAPAAPRSGRTARPERGFTDSELSDRLIPLVIVGILIAIAIPSMGRATAPSRRSR